MSRRLVLRRLAKIAAVAVLASAPAEPSAEREEFTLEDFTSWKNDSSRRARESFHRPGAPSPLRRAAKRAAVFLTGLAAPRHAPGARILMYHRVNPTHPGDRLTIHPEAFRRQMEALLASGRPVQTLGAAVAGLRAGIVPPHGAVCLTFDDGFRDNFEHALPVLERLGLPATFFVVSGHVGTRRCIDRYRGCCNQDLPMDWNELRELLARGHDVGGHSRTHRELAGLTLEEARGEVAGCRADLAAGLAAAPGQFCYPRGSETPTVRRLVADAGYSAACTVYPGLNPPGVDPYGLRRTEVSGDDTLQDFARKLEGGFDAWHRLVQRVQSWGVA